MILLDYKDRRPIYEQVVSKLEELMLLGAMKENEPLPSVRSLAMELSINPNTIQKETARQKENKSIFALLVAAGERLMRIIQKNRDCANKDIKKFTAEVNALCEKWDL